MRVNNHEKLREQLYRNLKDVYFYRTETRVYGMVEYREENLKHENKGTMEIRVLQNPIGFSFHHWDGNKIVRDGELYMCVYDDGVTFFLNDPGKQCFKYLTTKYYEYSTNKTVFMMEVARDIESYLSKYRVE